MPQANSEIRRIFTRLFLGIRLRLEGMKAIIGIFTEISEAETAVNRFKEAGFAEKINAGGVAELAIVTAATAPFA